MNAHDSKRDVLRTAGVPAFAIDQSGIKCTRAAVNTGAAAKSGAYGIGGASVDK